MGINDWFGHRKMIEGGEYQIIVKLWRRYQYRSWQMSWETCHSKILLILNNLVMITILRKAKLPRYFSFGLIGIRKFKTDLCQNKRNKSYITEQLESGEIARGAKPTFFSSLSLFVMFKKQRFFLSTICGNLMVLNIVPIW